MFSKFNWELIVGKIGTVLVDRRFWFEWFFPVVLALRVFPWLADKDVGTLSDQAVEWAKLVVALLVPIVSSLHLGQSWTKRPPSGLGYKDIAAEMASKLRDLGVR